MNDTNNKLRLEIEGTRITSTQFTKSVTGIEQKINWIVNVESGSINISVSPDTADIMHLIL